MYNSYLTAVYMVLKEVSADSGERHVVSTPVMTSSTPPSVAMENDTDKMSGGSSEYMSRKWLLTITAAIEPMIIVTPAFYNYIISILSYKLFKTKVQNNAGN